MAVLIAVTGFTGAGKTTTVSFLKSLLAGQVIYLGEAVRNAVRERGLALTAENERIVRLELRKENPAALALAQVDQVVSHLENGTAVMVDAICLLPEFEVLKAEASKHSVHLIGLDASFETRCRRLSMRTDRPFTANEVEARDRIEIEELGTDRVLSAASHTILNEGSMHELHLALTRFASQLVH